MILLQNGKYLTIGVFAYTCGQNFQRTQDRNDALNKLQPKCKGELL